MFDRLLLAYSSGLVAAVSPCVIVLIPLCLVRFMRHNGGKEPDSIGIKKNSLHLDLVEFLLGFQLSYILFGFLLSEVLTSSIQNGFKLALGTLFLVSSILAWQSRVDPLRLPMVESPFATGASFALLLSFNPCTVPFLAVLISLSNPAHTLLSLVCFGQGLITPAMLVVLMGQGVMERLEESAFKLEKIKHVTYLLLGGSGAYLLAGQVYTMSMGDVAVGAVGLVLALFMVSHSSPPPSNVSPFAKKSAVPDPPKPRCTLTRILVPVVLVLTTLGVACVLYEHNAFTHTAVATMLSDAGKAKPARPTQTVELYSTIPIESALAGVDASSVGSNGKMHQLRRQLTGASSLATSQPTDGIKPPSSPSLDAQSERDYHHLDQDPLEAPSIIDPTSPTEELTEGDQSPSDHHHNQPSNVDGIDVHMSGLDLSQIDLSELAALSESQEDDSAQCVDMSMVPPCEQCDFIVLMYRAAVMLVVVVALAWERIETIFGAHHPSIPHGSVLSSPYGRSTTTVASIFRLPASIVRVLTRKIFSREFIKEHHLAI